MYKNIVWNTGAAAMRARARAQRDAGQFNLKLKEKKRKKGISPQARKRVGPPNKESGFKPSSLTGCKL